MEKKIEEKKGMLILLLILLYQVIFVMVLYFSGIREGGINNLIWGILFLVTIILDLGLVYLHYSYSKKRRLEKELANLYEKRRVEEEHYAFLSKSISQLNPLGEEIKKHFQDLLLVVQKEEGWKELEEKVLSTEEKVRDSKLRRYCVNSIVNAILTNKDELCKTKGIFLSIEGELEEKLEVEAIDLCSLFSNLLDNAIEACDKIEAGKDKYIELKMFQHSDYLIIKIKNTYSGTVCLEKNRIRTEKKDKQNHGYGLLLLEKIAKKYRGKMKLEVQEQCFINLINIKIY